MRDQEDNGTAFNQAAFCNSCSRIGTGGRVAAAVRDFMKPITIKVRTTQNDYLSKVRDLKPYHRKLIVDVLEKCDLMPKNRDEMNKGLA